MTDPLGHTSSVVINSFGETVRTTDATNIQTTATFDQAGRQTAAANTGTGGTQPALTTTMTYNQRGLRTSTTTPEGRATVVVWDAGGRMSGVTVGTGGEAATTELFYDTAGNNTRVRNGRGFDTILTYQPWNLPETRVEPPATAGQPAANRTWTTSYDGAGLVTKEQQPGSVVLNRSFDDAGRPVSETATGAVGSRSFAYDLAGRVSSVSHPAGAVTVTYDDRGLPLTVGGGAGTTTYAWDDNGRIDVRTDPAGTADLSYDDAGRLISETDPVTGGMAEYGYDDAGRRTYTASHGPGGVPQNTPVRWTGHDDYGRTSWDVMPDINGGPDTYARSYGYDNDGLQTTVMVWGDSNPADGGFQWGTYNTRGELATWTDPTGATTDYTYDKAGNRTGAGAVTYTFDAQNRLTAAGTVTYAWSDRGTLSSVTSGGSTTTSTFDVWGQALTNGTVTLTYDGLGRIATRNSTPFTYSGLALDPVSDGAWVTNHSLDGTVLSTRQASGGNARWAVVDTHHNVAALRNPTTGIVDNTTRFDPYGVKATTTGTLTPSVGFQGDYTDPTTGEIWMGARHYQPSTATFTSRDTYNGRLDTPVSLNRYTYAHNNPLNMWDPDGHVATDASKATLSRLLAGVDVQSYKNNGDLGGYFTAVSGAFDGYRFTEAMNLVTFLGVDAAKAAATSYTTSVVDPTIAWGRDIAALAWANTKPSTERNRTPRQETTSTASGPAGVGSIDQPSSPDRSREVGGRGARHF